MPSTLQQDATSPHKFVDSQTTTHLEFRSLAKAFNAMAESFETKQDRLETVNSHLNVLSIRATLTQTYFSMRSAEAQAATLARSVAAYQRSLELTQNRYS